MRPYVPMKMVKGTLYLSWLYVITYLSSFIYADKSNLIGSYKDAILKYENKFDTSLFGHQLPKQLYDSLGISDDYSWRKESKNTFHVNIKSNNRESIARYVANSKEFHEECKRRGFKFYRFESVYDGESCREAKVSVHAYNLLPTGAWELTIFKDDRTDIHNLEDPSVNFKHVFDDYIEKEDIFIPDKIEIKPFTNMGQYESDFKLIYDVKSEMSWPGGVYVKITGQEIEPYLIFSHTSQKEFIISVEKLQNKYIWALNGKNIGITESESISDHKMNIEILFRYLKTADGFDTEYIFKWLSLVKITMNPKSILPPDWIEMSYE